MGLDERITWMLLGCVLGFTIGYFARTLQEIKVEVEECILEVHEIKEEVGEIDTFMKDRDRNEGGFMRIPWAADILMITVLALCVWASVSTGNTNNKLESAVSDLKAVQKADNVQDRRIEKITQCTLEFTSKTIRALNERTTYTQAQANANVRVLAAQAEFLRIVLVIPPVTEAAKRSALEDYVVALSKFNEVAAKNRATVREHSFPTNKELAGCLGVALPEVETGAKAG